MVNLAEMSRIIRSADKVLSAIENAEVRATSTTRPIGNVPHTNLKKSLVETGAVTIADLKDVYGETVRAVQAMREELSEMIDTLPDMTDRVIMRLRYVKGYTPEAIAEATYHSERNVLYHMKKAKQQLTEMYPGRFIDEEEPRGRRQT